MKPPRISEWLLLRSHPRAEREAVAGDLAEEFAAIGAREGVRAARRWYRRQMLGSLVPNAGRRIRNRGSMARRASAAVARGLCMRSIDQDIRFTWRLARRRPFVTAVTVASLVLGISVCTVVFTLLDAAVLRPLPVAAPDRLALLVERRPASTNRNFSYPEFVDYRHLQQAFDDVIAYSAVEPTLRIGSDAQPIAGELVSGSFFRTLGIGARLGRTLHERDDHPAAAPVAVVSVPLWRRLGGDDTFEPRAIVLNGAAFDIVGVAEPSFRGMQIGRHAMIWLPLAQQPLIEPRTDGLNLLQTRLSSWLTILGRLRDGVSLDAAAADLMRVDAALAGTPEHRLKTLDVEPGGRGSSTFPERAAPTLRLLLAAALLVLVIASANVANLMLARTSDRSAEFAVRAAMGAGGFRLARLVLVETLLLGACAVAASLLVTHWTAGAVLPLIRRFGEPVALDLSLHWRTLAFAAAVGIGAALLAASAPVIHTLRRAPASGLAGAGRSGSTGAAGGRARTALIVVQFALALALVVTAALLVRTVANLLALPTGYDAEHVALLRVDPSTAFADADRIALYVEEAERRLSAVPGVRAVGFARVPPVGFGGSRMTIAVPGYEPQPDEDMELNYNAVTDGYFEATGILVIQGRALTSADRAGRPLVAVVNETMAARFWAGRRAVGESFTQGSQSVEVVGVAADVKYRDMREAARPSFYMSVRQLPSRYGVFHVRTHGDPARLLETLRQALVAGEPRVPVIEARTLREQVRYNVNDDRLAMIVGGVLGAAALLLATAGLFAAMWQTVGRRTREIGVRMALGAAAADVSRLFLGRGLAIALAGGLLGAALAFWMARLVESRLFGVSPLDPASFLAAFVVLGVAALIASLAPARRAARVDPVIALRAD